MSAARAAGWLAVGVLAALLGCSPAADDDRADEPGDGLPVPTGGGDTATIRGRVVEYPGGAPIEGMSVVAFDVQARYVIATTDADGDYAIEELPPDFYRVKAWPLDGQDYIGAYYEDLYFYCTGALLDLRPGGVVEGIDFHLPGGGTIRGTITDAASGDPIADARVDVRGLDYYNANLDPSVHTDEDGGFEVVGLDSAIEDLETMAPVPGNYELKVTVPGHPVIYWPGVYDADDAEPVTALRGEVHDGLDLALPQGGTLAGVVRGPDGEPATAGSVRARHQLQTWMSTTAGVLSDGTFTLGGLAPGPWLLETHADGLASAETDEPVELDEDGAVDDLEIALATEAILTGRLTGLGEPLADVTVRAVPAGGGLDLSLRTDDDGAFSVGGLSAGEYVLQLSGAPDHLLGGYACGGTSCADQDDASRFATAAGETLDVGTVALAPAAVLEGRVTERDSGRPLGRIYVTALPETDGLPSPLAVSDDDGAFRIGALPPGDYSLQAEPYRYCSGDPGWPTTYSGDARRPEDALVLYLGEGAELDVELALPADVDGDGMADLWEWLHGLEPDRDDALEDPDLDGVVNIDEYLEGSDPRDDLADGGGCHTAAGGPDGGAPGALALAWLVWLRRRPGRLGAGARLRTTRTRER